MRKTSIKTLIALALSSSAIAAEPFSFEGTWYFDRYNPLNNGLLQVKDCRYASCDIELQTLWGNKGCNLSGEMELITNEKAQIIRENSINSRGACQIDIIHSGNGQITITSKNCETLCQKGASFDGKYENAALSLAYPTGFDCRNERNTYAEATICQDKTLSLAELEVKKLQPNSKIAKKTIEEWTSQRNICKTDKQCLNQKYMEYINALLNELYGEGATLQDYYQLTQTGYAAPLESYMLRYILENKLSAEQIKMLEKQMAIRNDYSDKNKIFLTYSPLEEETKEKTCFYLQDNNLWLGLLDKDENGLNQITIYAPQRMLLSQTPEEISNWQQKLSSAPNNIKINFQPIL